MPFTFPSGNVAKIAYDRSNEALVKSTEALSNSESTQEQLDQIVLDGDSSVEAAQARVDTDGETHQTLKERLDSEHVEVNNKIDNVDAQASGRLDDIEGSLSQQDQQTKSLHHGTQVIESDQSSPLKVEFYGKSRINYMGREGSFHNQGKWDSNIVIDTSTYKFGTSSGEIDNSNGSSTKNSTNNQKLNITGEYVLFGIHAKGVSGTPKIRILLLEYDSEGSFLSNKEKYFDINDEWNFYYNEFDLTSNNGSYWVLRLEVVTYGTADDVVNFDGALIEKITQEQYDAIGVSKTDEDVLREHNYIESVQHVENPVLSVSGSNLISGFPIWDEIHSNAVIKSSYELEVTGTSGQYNSSRIFVDVKEGETYTISYESSGYSSVYAYDNGRGDSLKYTTDGNQKTFTIPNGYQEIEVVFTNNGEAGTFTFTQPMLNLGTTAKPFVERNPSYLYAETVLAGLPNSNEKDISSDKLYQSDGTWYKEKWWETDVKLDGSLDWRFVSDSGGFKQVRIYPTSYIFEEDTTGELVKFDGSIMVEGTASNVDEFDITNTLYLTISDSDSGWGEDYTPTENDVKRYFNGWKYVDGTTWESIVDSSETTDAQGALDNQATDYKNYFLSYQLADPATENVDHLVEGSLSIEGDAQVYVDSGIVPREHTVPSYNPNNDQWYINEKGIATSIDDNPLNNKVSQILKIFKNGKDDTDNWEIYEDGYNQNGSTLARINDEDYDSTATYSVRYRPFKYDFTTNNNDIKVTYQTSLKSAIDSVVSKQSDQGTDISILSNMNEDMLARIIALEEGAS